MDTRWIKVFGERNTATRAVIRMIDASDGIQGVAHPGVDDEQLEPYEEMLRKVQQAYSGPWKRIYREAIKDIRAETIGPLGTWKHGAPTYHPDYRKEEISVLFMVRNPYSWIVSLHQRPYHNLGRRGETLNAFLTFPWLTVGRDNVDRILPTPALLWPLKVRSYQVFEEAAYQDGVLCASLRFEDFVDQPMDSLDRAMRVLGIDEAQLRPVRASTKPFGKMAEERRLYYAREEWKSALTRDAVSHINEMVDWNLAERYGYRQLRPADFPEEPASLHRERRPAAAARRRVRVLDDEAGADQLGRKINHRI